MPGFLAPRPAGKAWSQEKGRAMEETETAMNARVMTLSQSGVTKGVVHPGPPGAPGQAVTGSVGEASGPGGGNVMERIAVETSHRGSSVITGDVENGVPGLPGPPALSPVMNIQRKEPGPALMDIVLVMVMRLRFVVQSMEAGVTGDPLGVAVVVLGSGSGVATTLLLRMEAPPAVDPAVLHKGAEAGDRIGYYLGYYAWKIINLYLEK